jgi:hypothetical protein
MEVERHDPQKDVGKPHAQAEGGALGFSPLSASPMDGTDGGTTRRAPALTLEASQEPQDKWKKTSGHDRAERQAAPELSQEAAAYRARMLAKVGGDQSRDIAFTDAELGDFITHAQGLGFTQADIEAILIVKLRKPWVELDGLKQVANCLAERRQKFQIIDVDIFQDGWDFMRAYREAQAVMLGGGSLPPATYLTQDYIDMHKESFSDMASYLMTGKKHKLFIVDEKKESPNLGYKGALYISTAAEIDRILAEAGGDIAQIELNLGIPAGAWQDEGGLWRVDLIRPEEHLLRLPDGSEAAANEFWSPGGYTSGGTLEAVVNPVPKQEGVTYTARQVIFEDNTKNT